MDVKKFVSFTGDENEKEFLKKCLNQWDWTIQSGNSDVGKLVQIGTIFREMRHRIEELD